MNEQAKSRQPKSGKDKEIYFRQLELNYFQNLVCNICKYGRNSVILQRMKKRLSIIATSLAIILTMVAVGIHHHHHGEMMYLEVQECCDNTNAGSQHEDNNTDHTLHYLSAEIVKMLQSGYSSHSQNGDSVFGTFLAGNSIVCPLPVLSYCNNTPPLYHSTAYLSWRQRCRGLRGPPCV